MVKNLLTLVLKNNKMLVFKTKEDNSIKLPDFTIEEESKIDDVIKGNIISKLNIKEFNVVKVDKSLFKCDRTAVNRECKLCLVDIKDSDIEHALEENSPMIWMDVTSIYELSNFEISSIRAMVEQSIIERYDSYSLFMLEGELNKNASIKSYINRLKNQVEEKEIDKSASNKTIVTALILSIIVGISYSKFFFGYLGISSLIFTSIVIAYFVLINGIKNKKSFLGYFLMACSLILSLTLSIYTNTLLRTLNRMLIPITLVMSFILLSYEDIELDLSSFIKAFFKRIFHHSLKSSVKPPIFIVRLIKKRKIKEDNTTYKHIRNGLIISVPLVITLSMLLSEADNVFGYYLSRLGDNLLNFNINILSWKIVSSVLVALYLFGLIWSFKYSFKDGAKYDWKNESFEPITIITILVIVNILYFTFTRIQITYLYAGNSKVLPGGLTYAEYARKGFFELVFVAIINLISIGYLKLKVNKKNSSINRTLNILYTTITGFTLNMVVSAFYKMRLYINAFGYTRLRVLVEFFIVFLGLVLLIQLTFVWKEVKIFKPIIVLALVMYIGINFFNIDSYIAKKNIAFNNKEKLDTFYLTNLSFDAKKEIEAAFKEGKISRDSYEFWKDMNEHNTSHWYEYNYYLKKGISK